MHFSRYSASRRRRAACIPITIGIAIWIACLNGQVVWAGEPARSLRLTLALDDLEEHLTQCEWMDVLPPATSFGVQRLIAFEDHAYFTYLSGAVWKNKSPGAKASEVLEPEIVRRVIFIRPGIVVIDDGVAEHGAGEVSWTLTAPDVRSSHNQELVAAGKHARYRVRSLLPAAVKWRIDRSQEYGSANHSVLPPQDAMPEGMRILHVLSFSADRDASLPICSVERDAHGLQLELIEHTEPGAPGRVIRLWLPGGRASGRLEIDHRDGSELLAKRQLPAGILPPGLEAAQRRLQWNLAYRIDGLAIWDTQQPSSELRRLVESGQIKPCRTVEIGCGTGNDAIYLASQGFDVTAIDISPAALDLAEKKASQAGVQVQWLLADILQPPLLNSFDFVYDRGCYHEIRRHHAEPYLAAVRELTHKGSKVLILAASANKDSYWRFHGPPRVREEDIRKDFATGFHLLQLGEFRFDPVPSEQEGPLAWSILLERDERDSGINEDSTR